MPFRKMFKKTNRKAKSKKAGKSTKSKSKLTLNQKKEVKRLIHNEQENKYIFTGASDGNISNSPYALSFQSYAVSGGLPVIPIIQTIQDVSLLSADEQIVKGVATGQRIGSVIRVVKLKLFYTISIPLQFNTIYGYRYKVKAVIYKNKDSNEPSGQFGAGLNGYDIFRNGLNITADTNLCRPSSTISDFVCPIDESIYKVCYTKVFEITPPSYKDVNGDMENLSLSPVGISNVVDCTKFIKKRLVYDNLKSGSTQHSCTNDNLYMTFFTCDDTGSKLDSSAKFEVVYNHYLEWEDA